MKTIATLPAAAIASAILTSPLLAQTPVIAQNSAPSTAATGRPAVLRFEALEAGSAAPIVDGVLNDAIWTQGAAAGAFVQMRPEPGSAATERTEARVVYDDRYIYVGMRMFDAAPGEIAAQLARRDATGIYSDWAHVLIDSYFDRRTAFRFSVNPRGVQKDVLHFDDNGEDTNWDAVWEAETSQDAGGWSAEFRIPLSQLRYSGQGEGERLWGINFGREIARRGEWSWWSPTLPTIGGVVSQAGELSGLEGIKPASRLELQPYTVASVTREPGDRSNPFYERTAGGLNVGGDLRYGVTSNLTLSATFNPDFGQVEADASQVNLTALETFFSEKRPFFIEGANIFAFNVGTDDGSGESFFYSRRIGRSPQRSVQITDGWVERPDATRILGAAKLSGKTSTGWTVGVLSALTQAEYARTAGPTGINGREAIEPLANYSVASLSRDFRDGQSGIGIMATATQRQLDDNVAFDFLRSSAYSGGVRARHQFGDRAWEASGFLGGSYIRGSTESISRVQRAAGHYFQRPDADHLEYDPTRTSLSGAVGQVGLWKGGGSKWRGGVAAHVRTPGLELNDLGFQGETDRGMVFGNARYEQYEPQGIFRSWSLGINPSTGWTMGGTRLWSQFNHFANFALHNFWDGGYWTSRHFGGTSAGVLRGGPSVKVAPAWAGRFFINTDRRKAVALNAQIFGRREDDAGSTEVSISGGVNLRPSPELAISIGPSFTKRRNSWQYVTEGTSALGQHYLVGDLDQTTLSMTTRVNYTVGPKLSFQLYAQPFVSSGGYPTFLEVADPHADRYADRFTPLDTELTYNPATNRYSVDATGDGAVDFDFRRPDFSFRELRANAVVRWEYRPGSALFVVWSQGRTGETTDGDFDLQQNLDGLMEADATNVLLVKLSYWFNM